MNRTLLYTAGTFAPLQPVTPAFEAGPLDYREYHPAPELMPYVYCFWELSSAGKTLHRHPYHLVADGTADVLFDLTQQAAPMVSVTGDSAYDIALDGPVHYMGIRFMPACIHCFFPLSLTGLTGQTLEAASIFGKMLCDLNDRLAETPGTGSRIQLMNAFLCRRLEKEMPAPDPRFVRSLAHIFGSAGNARIQQQVADVVSSRQLRRMFDHYIGLSPKLFSRVVRFQQTLAAMQHTASDRRGSLFYDHGYYDQAHFIREFKLFYGSTPGSALFEK